MHYYDMAETWEFSRGPKLLYTQIIFQDGDKYFAAQLPEQIACPDEIPPSIKSYLEEIPVEHIHPPLEDGLSICHDAEKPTVYVKQPRLTAYDGSNSLSLYLLQEARICQILMQNEHQNIARYLGCEVKGGRVTGLCFQRYGETLADRLEAGLPVNYTDCLHQVRRGIDHLHGLNLVHNDIHSGNIMLEADTFVLIDFDSCAIKGHPLPDKRGRMPEGACTAEFENDDLGFEMLHEKLHQRCLVTEG